MATATITSNGRITIPKKVREALGVRTGDRVEFVPEGKGVYRFVAATQDVRRLKGLVPKPATPVSVSFVSAEAGALTRRVQRLVQMAESVNPRYETLAQSVTALQMLTLGVVFCLALLVISNPALLSGAHQLLEVFVRSLQ